ncbi:hypothetical protein [Clostridium perfringens]|nr:hypothetical protein [Clostridium perfringens]
MFRCVLTVLISALTKALALFKALLALLVASKPAILIASFFLESA